MDMQHICEEQCRSEQGSLLCFDVCNHDRKTGQVVICAVSDRNNDKKCIAWNVDNFDVEMVVVLGCGGAVGLTIDVRCGGRFFNSKTNHFKSKNSYIRYIMEMKQFLMFFTQSYEQCNKYKRTHIPNYREITQYSRA